MVAHGTSRRLLPPYCSDILLLILLGLHLVFSYRERCLREVLWQRISSGGIALNDLVAEMGVSTDSEDGGEFAAIGRTTRKNSMQAERYSNGGTEQGYTVGNPESLACVRVDIVVVFGSYWCLGQACVHGGVWPWICEHGDCIDDVLRFHLLENR